MDDDISDFSSEEASKRLFNTVLISCLFVVGVVGNATVLYIYGIKLHCKGRDRYFIPFLAIVDLMATISGSTLSILRNIHFGNFRSGAACKSLWYFTTLSTAVSALILMLIAVTRYRKVCQPLKPEFTSKCKNILLFITAGVEAVLVIPVILLRGLRPFEVRINNHTITGMSCSDTEIAPQFRALRIFYLAMAGLCVNAVLIVIVVLYWKIGRLIYTKLKVKKSKRAKEEKETHSEINDNVDNATKSTVFTLEEGKRTNDTVGETTVNKDRDGKTTNRTRGGYLSNRTSIQRRKNTRSVNNFTYMFMTVTVSYVVAYVPTVAFLLIPGSNPTEFWMKLSVPELNVYLTISRMFLLTHVLNPFVYLYFDLQLRRCIVDSLNCFTGL